MVLTLVVKVGMKETLDDFLTKTLGFKISRVERCLDIHRKGQNWIKLINYVNDALYTSNNEETRLEFETNLKKKFNLTLMGQAKRCLGMRIKQHKDYMSIDQEQYVKNITSRFEKAFKHPSN